MAYNKGDILIIQPYIDTGHFTYKDAQKKRKIIIYQSERNGEDISYHGTPYYEKLITVKDALTGELCEYGSQRWHWMKVLDYIDGLEDKLHDVYKLVSRFGNTYE